MNKYSEAITDYSTAIQILGNTNPKLYHNRGLAYAYDGDDLKAIQDFTVAIGLDPSNLDSYYNRGVAYTNLREYEKAIADLTKVVQSSKDPLMVKYAKDTITGILNATANYENNSTY